MRRVEFLLAFSASRSASARPEEAVTRGANMWWICIGRQRRLVIWDSPVIIYVRMVQCPLPCATSHRNESLIARDAAARLQRTVRCAPSHGPCWLHAGPRSTGSCHLRLDAAWDPGYGITVTSILNSGHAIYQVLISISTYLSLDRAAILVRSRLPSSLFRSVEMSWGWKCVVAAYSFSDYVYLAI